MLLMSALLFLSVLFLAYANGANDNFKGVASLYGSGTVRYRAALAWATVTTAAGGVVAYLFATELLKKFSGKGLVPDAFTTQPIFLLAVALGAGGTVILATRLGFPISTTHGLVGALCGAGWMAVGPEINLVALGNSFMLPLLLSPLLAVGLGGLVYLLLHGLRVRAGVTRESCVCAGVEVVTTSPVSGAVRAQLTVSTGEQADCSLRYSGTFVGVAAGRWVNVVHFISAGAVSFARGLNDTPKIAALLLVVSALDIHWGIGTVVVAMALGGWLHARRVAETMAHKITGLNPGSGLSANLATALLVTAASYFGLPVSTTHVSVGALVGIGIATRRAHWKPVLGVLASWVITLPCAALLAALAYALVR